MSLTADRPNLPASSPVAGAPLTQPLLPTDWQATPLADAVLTLASRDLTSFHALPLSHSDSIRGSRMQSRYDALYGAASLASEISYSGAMLDSYFAPRGPLLQAQRLAAEAFGADHTFFISSGTSTANRVVLNAFTQPGERVLADRSCHQSVHFTLPGLGVEVDYAPVRSCCDRCPREFADLHRLLQMYADAVKQGRPYSTVVLSATSYDGIRYDLPVILSELAQIHADVRVVVDEAWGAAHYFHPQLRALTSLAAWEALRSRKAVTDGMELAVTHSAHKSLSALRQGSYLHLEGSATMKQRVSQEIFQHHTTSPSWPILASLDLARAQAVSEGKQLLQRSMDLADTIRNEIATDPHLSAYEVLPQPDQDQLRSLLVYDDPLRVMVDVGGLGMPVGTFRQRLFEDDGIYIARESATAVLLHVHIGVSEAKVHKLLDGMRAIQKSQPPSTRPDFDGNQFIIAYPPGIPITVPGERLDAERRSQIAALRARGSEVYTLQGRVQQRAADNPEA